MIIWTILGYWGLLALGFALGYFTHGLLCAAGGRKDDAEKG